MISNNQLFKYNEKELNKYDSICNILSNEYCKNKGQHLKYLTHSYLINKNWVQYTTVYSVKPEKIKVIINNCNSFLVLKEYENNFKYKDFMGYVLKIKGSKNILFDKYEKEEKSIYNIYDIENNLYYVVVRVVK